MRSRSRKWLAKDMRVFNVFNYITLRAVLACLTALAILAGARALRDSQADRLQNRPGSARRRPALHLTKAGTRPWAAR